MTEPAPEQPSESSIEAATRIVRSLTGGRWTWPPVRVREVYPVSAGRIHLVGRPVREIVEVKDFRTGDVIDPSKYRQVSQSNVVFDGGCRQPIEITYEYGSEPSALAQKAIDVLAEELDLAADDNEKCRLPDRVTSITRQGVSYTFLDPNDILDKGRTGIYEIDLAIRAAGGGGRKRARVFSPEFPVPDRLETTVLPLPAPPGG